MVPDSFFSSISLEYLAIAVALGASSAIVFARGANRALWSWWILIAIILLLSYHALSTNWRGPFGHSRNTSRSVARSGVKRTRSAPVTSRRSGWRSMRS